MNNSAPFGCSSSRSPSMALVPPWGAAARRGKEQHECHATTAATPRSYHPGHGGRSGARAPQRGASAPVRRARGPRKCVRRQAPGYGTAVAPCACRDADREQGGHTMYVKDLMTAHPITVPLDMPVIEAKQLMTRMRFRH